MVTASYGPDDRHLSARLIIFNLYIYIIYENSFLILFFLLLLLHLFFKREEEEEDDRDNPPFYIPFFEKLAASMQSHTVD